MAHPLYYRVVAVVAAVVAAVAAVVVQPVLTVPFQPLPMKEFRWNLGKMDSPRPRNPQNLAL